LQISFVEGLLKRPEQIKSWEAHKKSYQKAHDVAEEVELKLLQHVAKGLYGEEFPLFYMFPTRPILQFFDPEIKVIESRMDIYLPDNTLRGLEWGYEKFVPLEFNPEYIERCFEMFEGFGSEYFLSGFKEKVLEVTKKFTERINNKYGKRKEKCWGEIAKNPWGNYAPTNYGINH